MTLPSEPPSLSCGVVRETEVDNAAEVPLELIDQCPENDDDISLLNVDGACVLKVCCCLMAWRTKLPLLLSVSTIDEVFR